jgi:hypothetical protein
MATHDYVIDNQTAPNFRSDLNNALAAIVTQNSNATAPSVTYANMFWYDTANKLLRKRNESNSGWITLGTIDEALGTFTPSGTGKAFLGNAQFLTTDTTLTSADDKDLLVCSANITVTLPAVSEGLVFGFVNASDDFVIIDTANPATTVGLAAGGALLYPFREVIVVCDGIGWQVIGDGDTVQVQTVQFPFSETYVPHPEAKLFLACVTGATGGTRFTVNVGKGGSGGAGYSEKLYTAPFSASYSVTVGFGGAAAGTGGTTTFDTISIPSSAGSTGLGGTLGATGTGGDFNATGGTGGAAGGGRGGGGGGAATRAGNGGNGGNGATSISGAGGGTGGNNASGDTPGAAATAVSGSAYSLTAFANAVTFQAGNSNVRYGASSLNQYSGFGTDFTIGTATSGGGAYGNLDSSSTGVTGQPGHVTIVEIF